MVFTPDLNLVQEQRRWLGAFDPQHLRNWEKLLNADAEAAACEAAVRRLLEANGNIVAPNVNLTGSTQSPDFRCTHGGRVFYVEVTCISIEKATEITSLPPLPAGTHGAQGYGLLNGAFFGSVKQKTPQCSGLDAPALVAVGTFHFQASCICFGEPHLEMLLTGDELITQKINMVTGDPVGDIYLSTKLRSATFLRPDANTGLGHARNPVTGMLLCGFGCEPPEVRGILHPLPVHQFERHLLPNVKFCRLRPGYETGSLSTEWI